MRILATLAFLFSAQAFACPQLSGNFTCTYQDGTSEVVAISQSADKAGVVTYLYNGSEVPADNVTYDIPDDQDIKGGKFRAWCDDDITLKSEMTGKYWNNGSYFGDLVMNISFEMEGTSLKQTTTGSVVNSGGTYPLDNTMVCTSTP
mgnify:CR=1 FL=1